MNKMHMAIDPGLSGGFAWWDGEEAYHRKMPDSIEGIYSFLRNFSDRNTVVLMEKVGKHRLGNSAQSSGVFAKHVGHLEMAVVACDLPTSKVHPTVWMKDVVPDRPKGVDPRRVRERKNYIKAQMQERFPYLRVNLYTSDALAMLVYFLNHKEEYT
jgi:hypothetical protein